MFKFFGNTIRIIPSNKYCASDTGVGILLTLSHNIPGDFASTLLIGFRENGEIRDMSFSYSDGSEPIPSLTLFTFVFGKGLKEVTLTFNGNGMHLITEIVDIPSLLIGISKITSELSACIGSNNPNILAAPLLKEIQQSAIFCHESLKVSDGILDNINQNIITKFINSLTNKFSEEITRVTSIKTTTSTNQVS